MFGPFQALEAFFMNAFNFTGRASRSEYWWMFLSLTLIFGIAVAVDLYTLLYSGIEIYSPMAFLTVWVGLITFVPNLSLHARRLHDSGRTALLYLLILVPLIGPIIVMILMASPSEPEDNKWGGPRAPGGGYTAKTRKGVNDDGSETRHNPFQAYAYLINGDADPTPEMQERRKQEVADYYRARVLRQPEA